MLGPFVVGSLLGLHLYFVVHTKCEPVPILIAGVNGSVIETILMIAVLAAKLEAIDNRFFHAGQTF